MSSEEFSKKHSSKLSLIIDTKDYETKFNTLNLNTDENKDSKDFWRKQLMILIDKFGDQALNSERDNETTEERVKKFQRDYKIEVERLMDVERNDYLSVRELLQLNEVLLKKYNFIDIWRKQKQLENSTALLLLEKRLNEIDAITDEAKRWEDIFFGLFAGNVFDYGATAVQEIIKSFKLFGFSDALHKVQKRPWLDDDFDEFVNRISQKKYNCCAFFCDNAGVDIVLGVLPFIREFLKNGIKIILCANSKPSLNDITFDELTSEVIEEAGKVCDIIKNSKQNKNLVLSKTGASSCCLNFLEIDENLLDLMLSMKVDLIVIEGMGRAIHTNLNAEFKVDSLKLAVIKNKFLAAKLGGQLFDVICKFEKKRDI